MKIFLLIFLFLGVCVSANSQSPLIGTIDFYGLRNVSESDVRTALQLKEGDALPPSKDDVLKRLESLPNVEQASLTGACCEARKFALFVGVREKGAASLPFRAAPTSVVCLPGEVVKTSNAFSDALMKAVQNGDAGEDDSQGHALVNNREARAFQKRYIDFAARDLKLLRKVLRESANAEHRALAVEIIAYRKDKRKIVEDLIYGMSDSDAGVRNNSMRALAVMAGFAQNSPEKKIKIPFEPFVNILNSLEWTDRNKSLGALVSLTQKRDPVLLSALRQTALQSLIEMAFWKSNYANWPFVILGRIGNFSENEIETAWNGNRPEFVRAVQNKLQRNQK